MNGVYGMAGLSVTVRSSGSCNRDAGRAHLFLAFSCTWNFKQAVDALMKLFLLETGVEDDGRVNVV